MNKIKKTSTIALACTAGCFLSSTHADILFFLLDEGGQDAWDTALAERQLKVHEQFNLTDRYGDPGILGIDGPSMFGDIGIDSNIHPYGEGGRAGRGPGGTGLTLVGVSAGFGNKETAVVSGYFVDSTDIFSVGEFPRAIELTVMTIMAEDSATVTIYDPSESAIAQIPNLIAPVSGTRIGILASGDDEIGRVNIYDANRGEGEGILGEVITYIPAPGVIALLSMGMLIKHRRRKC